MANTVPHIPITPQMYWKDGILYKGNSVVIHTSPASSPLLPTCLIRPRSCLFRLFENCHVYPVDRVIIFQNISSTLYVDRSGHADLTIHSIPYLPIHLQFPAHTLLTARTKRLKQIEIKLNEKKIYNKKYYRQRQSKKQIYNHHNGNSSGNNPDQFLLDVDSEDSSHRQVNETHTIGSSIPPEGMTKCCCHIYHANPWNGKCDFCLEFCIRSRRNSVLTLPQYVYNNSNESAGEEEDDIVSEYDDNSDNASDSDRGYGPLYFHPNSTTIERKRRKTTARQYQSPDYVLARDKYLEYTKKRPVDEAGLIRNHTPEEMTYFETTIRTMYVRPKLKSSLNVWASIPPKWYHNRRKDADMFPPREQTRSLIHFAQSACTSSTRMGWDKGLMSLEKNSPNRFCYALLLAISAQGMSDKSVVPHINTFIKNGIVLDIASLADCHYVSKLLRRTSKWVKNSSVVSNLAKHIIQQFNGIPPTLFSFYTGLNGFAHKTTSLLFWGWRHESICLPVDLHVKNYCQIFGWCRTNASGDEIAFQAMQWLEPELFIAFNDALGSIGQYISLGKKKCADSQKLDMLIEIAKQQKYDEVVPLLLSLRNEEE